ncbi:sortase A [Kribbella sp. VKM Ac-2571]|uniref:class E sortase n=1 Tax=Kribbella sp. VKM Ac-2571 TaxID=2512222 RepID=UPI001060D7A8|nr:class E sortase [Kribbella sp. VKM Ac-2571]TDO67497.1 sortase A [Kribbella sp. VKM Ac-2571]
MAVAVALLAAGVGLSGWIGWEYVGTNVTAQHRQQETKSTLQQEWRAGQSSVDPGRGFALLRVPRFGKDYEVPIIRGIDDKSLASGAGWFPHSQRPGEPGNFAIAAHRVTHGQPFRDFPRLRKGDKVSVETRDEVLIYTLDDSGTDHHVPFTESWIVDPVPGRPGAVPTRALITLTTCAELFRTDDRSYVFGHLTERRRKPAR